MSNLQTNGLTCKQLPQYDVHMYVIYRSEVHVSNLPHKRLTCKPLPFPVPPYFHPSSYYIKPSHTTGLCCSFRQCSALFRTFRCCCIRQHTSAHVSIRQCSALFRSTCRCSLRPRLLHSRPTLSSSSSCYSFALIWILPLAQRLQFDTRCKHTLRLTTRFVPLRAQVSVCVLLYQ